MFGLLFRIGIGILAAAVVTAVVLAVISKKSIIEELRKRGLGFAITKNIERGDVNYVPCGLYDKQGNFVEDVKFESNRLSPDIKEGMKIYA